MTISLWVRTTGQAASTGPRLSKQQMSKGGWAARWHAGSQWLKLDWTPAPPPLPRNGLSFSCFWVCLLFCNWSVSKPLTYVNGHLSEGNENTNLKRYAHPMFIAASFTTAKPWKQPMCPSVDTWMKMDTKRPNTMWYTHTMDCYSAIKRGGSLAIRSNVDGPRRYGAQWNKSDKDKCHMISLICGILKKEKYPWKKNSILLMSYVVLKCSKWTLASVFSFDHHMK